MYRQLTWVFIGIWDLARHLPGRIARSAAISGLIITALGLSAITLHEELTVGAVTGYLQDETGNASLARLELPGVAPQLVTIYTDPLIDEITPSKTWVLAKGQVSEIGGALLFEADRFVASEIDPDLRSWLPEMVSEAPWILVAAGLAVLVFSTHALTAACGGMIAALSAAIVWHALHIAGFYGVLSDVFILEPVLLLAGSVLGMAIGLQTATVAPAGVTVRAAAAAATLLLVPWASETFGLPTETIVWAPMLVVALPALLPAIGATLLTAEGLQLSGLETQILFLVASLISLLLVRYSHLTAPFISSFPDTHPTEKKVTK